MRRVSGNADGVLIDGYVGVQELSRGNRQQQSFFVNGRYFRDDLLSRALESGTEGFVMIGRFPTCVLNLRMAYEQVDVNVHPNKLEVRFQNPAAVMQAVETVVRDALRTETIEEKLSPASAIRQSRSRRPDRGRGACNEDVEALQYPPIAKANNTMLHESAEPARKPMVMETLSRPPVAAPSVPALPVSAQPVQTMPEPVQEAIPGSG